MGRGIAGALMVLDERAAWRRYEEAQKARVRAGVALADAVIGAQSPETVERLKGTYTRHVQTEVNAMMSWVEWDALLKRVEPVEKRSIWKPRYSRQGGIDDHSSADLAYPYEPTLRERVRSAFRKVRS